MDTLPVRCELLGHKPFDYDPTGGDPSFGGPVLITICERCGRELEKSEEAVAFNNRVAYEEELERSLSIIRSWPKSKFRRSRLTGRWQLKDR